VRLEDRIEQSIGRGLDAFDELAGSAESMSAEALQVAAAVEHLAEARGQILSDDDFPDMASLAEAMVEVPERLDRIEAHLAEQARSPAD
jgi:hypothetical protein